MTESPLRLHHLDVLLNPSSIAIIGASDDPRKIGGRPLRYLAEAGYGGAVFPINPRYETVQGLPAYPSITSVAEPVDMALVALEASAAVAAVRECAQAGVKVVVLFSAGFAETGAAGAHLQDELRDIAAASGMRILGPNCLGVMNVGAAMIGSFTTALDAHGPLPGTIGFVSQSGAFGAHCMMAARGRGLGFGKWITTGNEVDIDFADVVAYLAEDPETDVIVGYMEGCRDGDSLHAALALAQERKKPVIMLKVGASEVGSHAVASHTATMVGSDASYDAVFRRYGVLRASTIGEILDLGEACATSVLPRGDRVGLVTASGGIGIMMADVASQRGLDVAPMPADAQERLKEILAFSGVANPVDVTGQVSNNPELLEQFLLVMLEAGGYHSIVIYLGGLPWELAHRLREPLREVRTRYPDVPIILSVLDSPETHERFTSQEALCIPDPIDAVVTAAGMAWLGKQRITAVEYGAEPTAAVPAAPDGVLNEHELKQVLATVGVPVLAESVVTDEDAAVAAAAAIGGDVVMKVASARLAHKTEIGGVIVGVGGEDGVRSAFRTLLERAAEHVAGAEEDGVLIAPLVSGGVELIVGSHRDPVLGPLVMVGLGGVTAEVVKDVALRVPPFGPEEAKGMLQELHGWPLLTGWRGAPAVDVDAAADALAALSRVAAAWSEDVESIEINPLVALPRGQGVVALDALMVRRTR